MPASLPERLAQELDIPAASAEKLLQAMTREMKRQVARGRTLRIGPLGAFRAGDDDAITFAPSDALAKAVNRSYAGLEPEVIPVPETRGADEPASDEDDLDASLDAVATEAVEEAPPRETEATPPRDEGDDGFTDALFGAATATEGEDEEDDWSPLDEATAPAPTGEWQAAPADAPAEASPEPAEEPPPTDEWQAAAPVDEPAEEPAPTGTSADEPAPTGAWQAAPMDAPDQEPVSVPDEPPPRSRPSTYDVMPPGFGRNAPSTGDDTRQPSPPAPSHAEANTADEVHDTDSSWDFSPAAAERDEPEEEAGTGAWTAFDEAVATGSMNAPSVAEMFGVPEDVEVPEPESHASSLGFSDFTDRDTPPETTAPRDEPSSASSPAGGSFYDDVDDGGGWSSLGPTPTQPDAEPAYDRAPDRPAAEASPPSPATAAEEDAGTSSSRVLPLLAILTLVLIFAGGGYWLFTSDVFGGAPTADETATAPSDDAPTASAQTPSQQDAAPSEPEPSPPADTSPSEDEPSAPTEEPPTDEAPADEAPADAPSEPAPRDEPAPAAASPSLDLQQGGWGIVVASRTDRGDAESVARAFADRFPSRPTGVVEGVVNGQTYYRAVVGQYDSRAAAADARTRDANDLPEGAWLLRLPQR